MTFPYKLGKLPASDLTGVPRLANYPFVAPNPPSVFWGYKVPTTAWTMLGNDTTGDCTIAAAGHQIQTWTDDESAMVVPTEAECLAAYSGVTDPPYNPVTGANDYGASVLVVLAYWKRVGIAGHKIDAYAYCDYKQQAEVEQTIFAFGGCYLGIQLPLSAATQIEAGQNWEIPPGQSLTGPWAPASWGGHAVPAIAFNSYGVQVITWARPQWVSWGWIQTYGDEGWAVISQDWLGSGNRAPNGFNLAGLMADQRPVGS